VHFSQSLERVLEQHDAETAQGAVEGIVLEGQLLRRHALKRDVRQPESGRLGPGHPHHAVRGVHPHEADPALQAARQGQRRFPRARGEIEDVIPRLGGQVREQGLSHGRQLGQPEIEFFRNAVPIGLVVLGAHAVSFP
jgi:hypothetical protein